MYCNYAILTVRIGNVYVFCYYILIVDVTIPFTNELSDSIILVLKLNTNFSNNSLKDGMFKFTNISEALLCPDH